MIYLKRFNENNKSDYYNQMEEDDFYQIHFIKVDRKYLEQLKKEKTNHNIKYVVCDYLRWPLYPPPRDPDSDEQQMIIVGETPNSKFKSQSQRSSYLSDKPEYLLEFEIYEMSDEWFVVCILNIETFAYTYYKCDQWDGVIQLLKDKKLIQ